MQSFWDLLPARLWSTQPFIPPYEQARTLMALAQSAGAVAAPFSTTRPVANLAPSGTGMPAASPNADANANPGVMSQGAAGALRPKSFWDLLAPPPGQPFVPVPQTWGQFSPARAGLPVAPIAPDSQSANDSGILGPALARSAQSEDQSSANPQLGASVLQARSPASAGGIGTNLLSLGATAIRPITSYFPTQRQYAREGLDLMKQGWGDMTSGPIQAALPETIIGVGAVPTTPEKARGLGEMAWGAANYFGSPINAAIHTFFGQPVEDTIGIPSSYADFAAGLALPFAKRLPGLSASPIGTTRVPRMAPSAIADTPQNMPTQAATSRVARLRTFEEDNRSLLYDKARNMLQEIDPDNVKLTLTPANEIASIQDLRMLNDEIAVVKSQKRLYDLDPHHNFLQGKNFAWRFKAVGIDPDDYVTWMWNRAHRALDVGPNSWTWQWKRFLKENPEANLDMMHRQLNGMLRKAEER
jgi:hypothetical protein